MAEDAELSNGEHGGDAVVGGDAPEWIDRTFVYLDGDVFRGKPEQAEGLTGLPAVTVRRPFGIDTFWHVAPIGQDLEGSAWSVAVDGGALHVLAGERPVAIYGPRGWLNLTTHCQDLGEVASHLRR